MTLNFVLLLRVVEDIGLEPITQPCKGRIFPAILIPQYSKLAPQAGLEPAYRFVIRNTTH